jgi:hypothetical protein
MFLQVKSYGMSESYIKLYSKMTFDRVTYVMVGFFLPNKNI